MKREFKIGDIVRLKLGFWSQGTINIHGNNRYKVIDFNSKSTILSVCPLKGNKTNFLHPGYKCFPFSMELDVDFAIEKTVAEVLSE